MLPSAVEIRCISARGRRWSVSWLACLTVLLLGVWPSGAEAVLLGTADGTENTEPFSFFGWDYVGDVNGQSGTYLGDGWVITANHVGPGDLVIEGVVYPWVPGTDVQLESPSQKLADLVMFMVSPDPGLDALEIRDTPPPYRELSILIGCGRDRGPATSWDPNGPLPPPPDDLTGWDWGATYTKRWGTNEVEPLPAGLILDTVAFFTSFDDGEILPESHAADGDSGGALFTVGTSGTQLAGIIFAVGPTPGQPAGTALFTNVTFAARLDYYLDQIEDVIAMPEPTGGLAWGLALLGILARRRYPLARRG